MAIPPHLLLLMLYCQVWAGLQVYARYCWGSHALYGAHMSPSWSQMLSPISRDNLEIMSRGPQVLDMEYREQDWPEHGPGWPIFLLLRQICPVSNSSFHHHQLGLASERTLAPWGNWSKISWYVSCLIIITFLYMHQVPCISNNCLDLTRIHLTIVGVIDGVT